MRKLYFLLLIFISACTGEYDYPFQNPALSTEERIEDLLGRLTLEQKIAQTLHNAPAIDTLGIPAYNWWNECLHGVARAGVATVFPQAIGIGATFNEPLVHHMATVISDEARAKHHQALRDSSYGIYEGLTFWTPNINIFRDPRWGRGQETYGEDPYLTSRLGVAFVKGLQGDNEQYFKTIATPKHFAVHSGPEPERHSFNATTNEIDLHETYLPAFEATVREGKAFSVMGAYNAYNGVPACASEFLLQDLLRDKWGFKGYVVSDCGAIRDIHMYHNYTETAAEAAALAVKAGCELNCGSTYNALFEAVKKGFITEKEIDEALRKLLEARFRLGMFDPPELVPFAQIPYEVNNAPKHDSLARVVAQQSIVLLKNNGILPLKKDIAKIVVIGPNANDTRVLLGNYNGTPANPVTGLSGVKTTVAEKTEIMYAAGCNLTDMRPVMSTTPGEWFFTEEGKPGFNAQYFKNPDLLGNPFAQRRELEINSPWTLKALENLPKDTFSVRWTAQLKIPEDATYYFSITGDDGYRLFLDGKLLIKDWEKQAPDTKTASTFLESDRTYELVIEYFESSGGEEITFQMAKANTDIFADAVNAAKKADVVLFYGGLSPLLEGEEMDVDAPGFEGGDRTSIALPKVQTELLKRLKATGKPVVLVLMNGSAVAIPWEKENLDAIVEAWYPGQQGGNAIADVLFGDHNPSGRLPVTFYNSTEELPPFRDYSMQNRTYRYYKGEPLFPFGFGLSYSEFEYSQPVIRNTEISKTDSLYVSFTIANISDIPGHEVAQVYLLNKSLPEDYPEKELVSIIRETLAAGEVKEISVTLKPEDLEHYDPASGVETVMEGTYEIMVGGSSVNGKRAAFSVR